MHISELVEGQEITGWMRIGFPLRLSFNAKTKTPYRVVPSKPVKFETSDLTQFTGTVVSNFPELGFINVHVTATVSKGFVGSNTELVPTNADIPYTALKTLRLWSGYNLEPNNRNNAFPANIKQSRSMPYRTFTKVELNVR